MISQAKQKGFTIVELLIVIVVIAILAAISIVAYTNITARAKTSTAQATAKAVKDTAQNIQGVHGAFPATKANFVNGTVTGSSEDPVAKLPSDITFVSSVSDSTEPKQVMVKPRTTGTPAVTVGFQITYYDYAKKEIKTVDVGSATGTLESALSNTTP